MQISVVVPALNEEASIAMVVMRIPRDLVDEVIVVDNGSTDATSRVARDSGARVVREEHRGYGAACLAGSKEAKGDIIVFLDGDGSFDPGEIPRLIQPLTESRADLVLGSRELKSAQKQVMPIHQRFGNWLAIQLLRTRCGIQVTDLGPFRALRREQLMALHLTEMSYGWPIEMIIKAAQQNLRLFEVPVSYLPRYAGRSKVSGTVKGSLLAGYRIIRVILEHTAILGKPVKHA